MLVMVALRSKSKSWQVMQLFLYFAAQFHYPFRVETQVLPIEIQTAQKKKKNQLDLEFPPDLWATMVSQS